MIDKAKLGAAFRAMRKAGLIARQGFSCCSGCACSELNALGQASGKTEAVYYHRQDAEVLNERTRRSGGDLYIRFGALDSADNEASAAVGAKAMAALRAAGLRASWSGDANTCIVVHDEQAVAS